MTSAVSVARRTPSLTPALGACLAVAVVTLVVPTSLAFDPWAWLVWGREVLHLDLDTTGGPSWKPLPVLVTTPLALLGALAPTTWLVLARTLGLLAVVLAHRLAARFAGAVAGVIAAGGLLLSPDGGPRFLRLVAEGHSAPAEAALALWAVSSHLDGRVRRTLVLLTALALLRPEAWPFLGLYALWVWRHHAGERALTVLLLAAIPLLWFGGDWWGAGDPLHGAGDAQVIDDPAGERLAEGLDHAAKVVVVPIWIGVAAALVTAHRRRERELLVLGAAAGAWLALVVAMGAALRYAALSRFFLPAGALLCVLGGVGLVRLVAGAPAGRPRRAVVAGLAAATVLFAGPRVVGVADQVDGLTERAAIEDDLVDAVDRAGGRETVLACGAVVADPTDLPQPALAWELEIPMADVHPRSPRSPHVAVVGTEGRMARRLLADEGREVEVLGANRRWAVLAVDCPAAAQG